MRIDLTDLIPPIKTSLNGIGFLFGAGTSAEAGYPMMSQLTNTVVSKLSTDERNILDKVLLTYNTEYDSSSSSPNIEELADMVIAYYINTGEKEVVALETRLKKLIISELLSIKSPNIDNHVRFFKGLKARSFGLPNTVWIFTTNYDLLFEIGAAKAGVVLENGFIGSTMSYFDPQTFTHTRGTVTGNRFEKYNNLTVKLIKLHGSLSWLNENGRLYECHPDSISISTERCVVLPRRKKVMETLDEPYNQLFTLNRQVLGNECKYLLSCGFSFSDEHINKNILIPTLSNNRCTLACLCKEEPAGISTFKGLASVRCAFSNSSINCGSANAGTELWKFSELAGAILK